jgi:dTDP-4-dehydrorhamnose reductase
VHSSYNLEKVDVELKMKELLIVGNGFLGTELKKELISENVYKISGTSKNLSHENYFNLNEKHNLKLEKFKVIILLAAITNICFCENNRKLCYETNFKSTIRFINEAVSKGCFVIFLSTNAVFDGRKSFYSFDDEHNPLTRYGEYKSLVEQWITKNCCNKVAILRLTKVLPKKENAPFVKKWIDEVSLNRVSKVFTNHFISPISTLEAIEAIKKLITCEMGGVFQKGADFELSYADYAKEFFKDKSQIYIHLEKVQQGDRNFYNSLKTYLPK